MASDTPLVAAKPRLRKKRVGSMGVLVRDSHRANAASSTAPPAIDPTTVALVQPSACARTIPNTTPSRPRLARPTPGRSSVE